MPSSFARPSLLHRSVAALARQLRAPCSARGRAQVGFRNAVEEYEWDAAAGLIRITLSYEEGGTGRLRSVQRKAWVYDVQTGAEWRIKVEAPRSPSPSPMISSHLV